MLPKEFIRITFLDQYKKIAYEYYYISFVLIAIGIEFLGKCLDEKVSWQQSGFSKTHFDKTINELMPKYKPYNDIFHLADSLRNGMAHAFLPKSGIGFTNREEAKRYYNRNLKITNKQLTLVAENLYDDFEAACKKILEFDFPENSKMNRPILSTPTPLIK